MGVGCAVGHWGTGRAGRVCRARGALGEKTGGCWERRQKGYKDGTGHRRQQRMEGAVGVGVRGSGALPRVMPQGMGVCEP